MDPVTIAAAATAVLTPVAGKIWDKAVDAVGDAAGDTVKKLWGKLADKIMGKEAAREAMEDLAKNPDDTDAQGQLRKQLAKMLEADETLAREVASIVNIDNSTTYITITASGDGSVAAHTITGGVTIGNVYKK